MAGWNDWYSMVILTYSMAQSPSWEGNWLAASQEIPHISWNPKVHYRNQSVRHLSLSWANPIQSKYPHSTSWRSILILSTHLRLGLPSGSLSLQFPHEDSIRPPLRPIHTTCPAHLILLDFITRTILGEAYRSLSSSLCSLLHSPVTSTLLSPNILLYTIFSNTLSFLSSFNFSDQASHPYKTAGKITVLYILIFNFLYRNLEDKRYCTESMVIPVVIYVHRYLAVLAYADHGWENLLSMLFCAYCMEGSTVI